MSDKAIYPDLIEDSDDENDDDDKMDDWVEDDESCQKVDCLFCDLQFETATQTFLHCNEKHNFNILNMKNIHKLDCYDYVRLINFIRLKSPSIKDLKTVHPYNAHPWSDDAYLVSTLIDDPLLYFDIESNLEKTIPQLSLTSNENYNGSNDIESNKEATVTISMDAYNSLLIDLHSANKKAELYQSQLEAAIGDLKSVKSTAKLLSRLDDTKNTKRTIDQSKQDAEIGAVGGGALKDDEDDDNDVEKSMTTITTTTIGGYDDYDYYFETYDHYSIHEEMLKDKIRTQSYKDAMVSNPSLFAGKTVLDLGCGTCILSMFATEAGAETVYAVDQSDIIYKAMDIIRENGLEKKIQCIKSKIEEVKLPVEKVDIIISEWMGYFLLFESMLESVVHSRDRFLKEGGLILPTHCNLYLGAYESEKHWNSRVKYWDDVYNYKMTCLRTSILLEADVDVLPAEAVLTDISCIKQLDIRTCQSSDIDFDSAFKLLALRDGNIHGFFGFFDTIFDLTHKVEFSTGPFGPETHWKQTLFLMPTPIPIVKGQKVDGRIYCKRNRKDHRSLDITLIIDNKKHKYYMN